jgi:poly-gamma-glutamate capsule biosynthesis protein CapA/YwtB (metallophosphatase superfamily)
MKVIRFVWRPHLIAFFAAALSLGAMPAAGEPDRSVTLVIVGDTGLGGDRAPVRPNRAMRHGGSHAFADLTRAIAPEIDGDLAFANLETVVAEHNNLRASSKRFVFRSHPNGIAHLVGLGFNVFSNANNHVGDYGTAGIIETLRNLDEIDGIKAAAGIGRSRDEAGSPRRFEIKGHQASLSAIGIGPGRTNAAGAAPRPGQLAYSQKEDFDEVVRRLGAEKGFRILSVHYGGELDVAPSSYDAKKLRDEAVRREGIDLVIGHHAHVAAGVQDVGGRIIFYGLGNFLHLGTRNMAGLGTCRDYGLLARVHMAPGSDERLAVKAIEVVPITDMHLKPRRMSPKAAITRLRVLNGLAKNLDITRIGARGVRFKPQSDGTGLHCLRGASKENGRIGELCRGWSEEAAARLAKASTPSCARTRAVVRSASHKGGNRRKGKRRKNRGYVNPFMSPYGF